MVIGRTTENTKYSDLPKHINSVDSIEVDRYATAKNHTGEKISLQDELIE